MSIETRVRSTTSLQGGAGGGGGGGGSGTGLTWSVVAGTSQTASINNGYILNNAALVTLTVPSTAAVGSIIAVVGFGAGGWRIAQNAGQTIHFGNIDTTTGTGGHLDSNNRYDCAELVCAVANTDWVLRDSQGNISYT